MVTGGTPEPSKWDVALAIAVALWFVACGAILVFARPLAASLVALPFRLVEGDQGADFYARRLLEVVPFLAVIGAAYAVLIHAVLLPDGRVARFLVAHGPWGAALLLAGVATVFGLAPRYLTGDEPHYVVMIESLWRDGDLDLSNQTDRAGLDVPAHTLPSARGGSAYSIHFPGLAILLALPFGVLGLKGVLVAIAALWAVLAVRVRLWVEETGQDSRGLGQAWWLILVFAMPLVAFSGEVYPEVPAALLLALALSRLESERVASRVTVAAAAGALVWLHVRFLALALMLAVAALARLRRGRWWPASAFMASLLLQMAVFWQWYGSPLPWVMYGRTAGGAVGNPAVGALGMLFDQQAGLLVVAPVYLLLGPALAAGWVRNRSRTAWRLALLGSYLGPVVASSSWHGFWSPPARMWVPVVPIIMVSLLEHLPRLASRLARGAALALGCASLAVGCLYVLFPDKRCGVLGEQGSNFFLSLIARATHLPVSLVFPHLQNPTGADIAVASVELCLWLVLTVLVYRRFKARADTAP